MRVQPPDCSVRLVRAAFPFVVEVVVAPVVYLDSEQTEVELEVALNSREL